MGEWLGEDDLVCSDQCFVAVASDERIVEHLEKIRICRDAVYLIILVVYHEVGRFNMDQACPLFYFRNGREQFRGSPGCHTDPISIADGIQFVRVRLIVTDIKFGVGIRGQKDDNSQCDS